MSGARGGVHDLSEQAKARFFPHDLDDDWRSPDLGRFGETASSSARRLLSACEALWRADAEEGRDLANGSVYAGTCGAALLLYKLAMMTNDDPPRTPGTSRPGWRAMRNTNAGFSSGKKETCSFARCRFVGPPPRRSTPAAWVPRDATSTSR
jgi:hypothetical protein